MTLNATQQEIERKFLVNHLPPGLGKLQPIHIQQGYLMQTESREVRLRRKGTKWFMTVKDGAGLQRQETEIALTKSQADTLWPMTHDRRIAKIRYEYPYKGHLLEVDIFKGDLDPLRLCEIEFATVDEANAFKAPDFLGEDVTQAPEYRNANLALHGQPNGSGIKERFGCLPFFEKEQTLYVVLVTNQSGTKWIFPKGQSEPGMTPAEVALMETYEEAGVLGTIIPGLHEQCTLEGGSILHLYPMKTAQLLDEWPEQNIRKRQIVKFKKAIQMLEDAALIQSAQALEARLKG